LQVTGQTVDDLSAPALGLLAVENLAANGPLEQNQLPADGLGGADLGRVDAGLQLLKEFGVSGGCLKGVWHLGTQFIRGGGVCNDK